MWARCSSRLEEGAVTIGCLAPGGAADPSHALLHVPLLVMETETWRSTALPTALVRFCFSCLFSSRVSSSLLSFPLLVFPFLLFSVLFLLQLPGFHFLMTWKDGNTRLLLICLLPLTMLTCGIYLLSPLNATQPQNAQHITARLWSPRFVSPFNTTHPPLPRSVSDVQLNSVLCGRH